MPGEGWRPGHCLPAYVALELGPLPSTGITTLAGSRLTRTRHLQGFPCCIHSTARACPRQFLAGDGRPFSFAPTGCTVVDSVPRNLGESASALTYLRPPRRSLALRLGRSLSRPRQTFSTRVLQSISLHS